MSPQGSTIRQRRLWGHGAAVKGYGLARRVAERFGLQIVLKTFYSPIPDLATLPAGIWERADPMRGIDWDLDAQVERLRALSGPIAEFAPPAGGAHAYEPANPSYPLPDARLLYAMIRDLRPKRIVELGSGQTSRVIGQACVANAAEGAAPRYRVFDPFPGPETATIPGVESLERLPAQQVPEHVLDELEAGDVLFVDTTHTVKIGSDVNHIVLRVLPRLAPGVVVHFHDICLPYEYPRYLLEDYALYWGEQYLLQAFLAMNPSFEVLYATAAIAKDRRAAVEEIGLASGSDSGSSFWMRRRSEPVAG
jgi:Methyltransferase domain